MTGRIWWRSTCKMLAQENFKTCNPPAFTNVCRENNKERGVKIRESRRIHLACPNRAAKPLPKTQPSPGHWSSVRQSTGETERSPSSPADDVQHLNAVKVEQGRAYRKANLVYRSTFDLLEMRVVAVAMDI